MNPNLKELYRAVLKYRWPVRVHAIAPGVVIVRTDFIPAGHHSERFFSLYNTVADMDNAHEYWRKEVEILSALGDKKERLRWMTSLKDCKYIA